MKWLPWILVALLATTLLLRNCNGEQESDVSVIDTVIHIDTVRDTVPKTVLVRFDHWDTLYIPLLIDSGIVDSVPFAIPIEKKEYRTENYHAVISGYKTELELMEVFRKTQTITLKTKSKRWGLGLQAGYGIPDGWYVGIGISYNIWIW
ncbi:DUF6808 domain-containing protein [uncultured Bacteroides sp.]|uniref:DUF6808 domain-containing protein n=1 Tax=uncultured Bacteroides sp. TaxID=162156 RepID=UPI002605518A|nr:hypothetical protein [uncultured Bacteroides sp.]